MDTHPESPLTPFSRMEDENSPLQSAGSTPSRGGSGRSSAVVAAHDAVSPPMSPPAASIGGADAQLGIDAEVCPELEIPPLRVAVLLAGTIGDVMPFIQLAKIMKERYGHVTRICSHGDLRRPVEEAGLRFYPLGGNAKEMAGWGPTFSLQPKILLKLALNPATSKKLIRMRAVLRSCLKACTEPDPADPSQEPFHADVLMANPMCLGHIHCAEALGIPLHLFFPNPWVATRDYPHSFSGWGYPNKPTPPEAPGPGFTWTKSAAHFVSYRLVDSVLWHTFLAFTNDLRATARLRTLRVGNFIGGTILDEAQVPFSQMWSPSLSPRPSDWPAHCDVVGFFFWDQKASEVDESSRELAPLVAWLREGPKPVYIGFGSMVFNGLKTARMIVEAVRQTNVRVLMQTATSGGTLELTNPADLPPNVFCIGRCPHDWLLPKMAAVIHHGGAGTVGAGLRLGLPTMCCPFFGDQFFYSHAVAASGCGPAPLPFESLTVAKLVDRFQSILEPKYKEGATRMAAKINAENGLEAGLAAFNTHLPIWDVVCDVSTLLGEKEAGRHFYPALRLKVSDEVHLTLRASSTIDQRLLASSRPHLTKQWEMGAFVTTPAQGCCTGLLASFWELIDAVISLVVLPVQAACWAGPLGFLQGIFTAAALAILRIVYAPLIFFDRCATGLVNSSTWARLCWCCPMQTTEGQIPRPIDHIIDPEPALIRIAHAARGTPPCSAPRARQDAGHADGRSRLPLHGPKSSAEGARRVAIEEAFTKVIALRRAFDALDAQSNDDFLSLGEIATLSEAGELREYPAVPSPARASGGSSGGGRGCVPASPSLMPVVEADRLPLLAKTIERYLRRKGKQHLAFAEFVLLCRDLDVG